LSLLKASAGGFVLVGQQSPPPELSKQKEEEREVLGLPEL
jgi:hypothetical protein